MGLYLPVAILLAIVAWSWVNLFRARSSKKTPAWRPLVVAGILTIAWTGLLGLQVWAALFPHQFSPDQFGIAVATFGAGPDFRVTRLGRQISGLLHDQLDEAITTTPELSDVALTSIGVVRDAEQGLVDGSNEEYVFFAQILLPDFGRSHADAPHRY